MSRSMGYRIISYSDNAYVSQDRCEFWQIDVRLSFQRCRCKGNGDIFSHFKVRICSPVSWYKSQSRASIWFQLRKDTRMQSWLRGMQLIWKIYSVATSEATSEGLHYDGFIFDLEFQSKSYFCQHIHGIDIDMDISVPITPPVRRWTGKNSQTIWSSIFSVSVGIMHRSTHYSFTTVKNTKIIYSKVITESFDVPSYWY